MKRHIWGVHAGFIVCQSPDFFKGRTHNLKTTRALLVPPAQRRQLTRIQTIHSDGNKWCLLRVSKFGFTGSLAQQSVYITRSLIVFSINEELSQSGSALARAAFNAGRIFHAVDENRRLGINVLTWFPCTWNAFKRVSDIWVFTAAEHRRKYRNTTWTIERKACGWAHSKQHRQRAVKSGEKGKCWSELLDGITWFGEMNPEGGQGDVFWRREKEMESAFWPTTDWCRFAWFASRTL